MLRCPKDVTPAELDHIISLSLKLISFDPNFAGDEDGEDGEGGNGAGSESDDGSFGSDDEDDNVEEDDESWKVRRGT